MDEKKTQPAAAASQLTELHELLTAERDARQPGAKGVTFLRFLVNMAIGLLLGIIAGIVLNVLHLGEGRMRFCLIWGAVMGVILTLHQVIRVNKIRKWARSKQTQDTLRKLRQDWLNNLRSACSRMRQQYRLRPKTEMAGGAQTRAAQPVNGRQAQKQPAPAQSQPAQKKSAPAQSQPAQKKPAPAQSQPAQKKPAPAQPQPAQKKPAPAQSQPAQKKPAPAQSQPAKKKGTAYDAQMAAAQAKLLAAGVRKPMSSPEEIQRRALEAQVAEAQAALKKQGAAPQPAAPAAPPKPSSDPQTQRERLIRSFREQMKEMERKRNEEQMEEMERKRDEEQPGGKKK